MPETLWHIRDLRLGRPDRPRLTIEQLAVLPGVTALLGPSGCGKTSLLNLLCGFERADVGSIARVFTSPARQQGVAARARNDDAAAGNPSLTVGARSAPRMGEPLAFVAARLPAFWAPADEGLWPHLTCAEHLRAVGARGADVTQWLARFDLLDATDARPGTLSQGQANRLNLARALASQAAVLLLDEPLAHVEPARQDAYWELLAEHVRQQQCSVIFATHQPQRALGLAEHAICLDAGRVTYAGTVELLYHQPPSEALARALGAVNWISNGEAERWLGGAQPAHPCVRPEQVTVEADAAGPLVVQSAQRLGAVARSELRLHDSEQVRPWWHLPPRALLQPGQRVRLRWLALSLLWLLLLLPGCGPGADTITPIEPAHVWLVPPVGATQPTPRVVEADQQGNLLVLDTAGRVLVYDPQGKLLRWWEMPEHEAGNPEGVCALRDGRIAVTDTHYYRVVLFTPEGKVDSMFGARGTEPGQFIFPSSLVQGPDDALYVSEYGGNDRIQKFKLDGTPVLSFGGVGVEPGQFQRASGMVLRDDKLYIADAVNHRIQVFSLEGKLLEVLGGATGEAAADLSLPYDLSPGPQGGWYVAEFGRSCVTLLSREGKLRARWGGVGRGLGQLTTPWSVLALQERTVIVADTGNRRLVEFIP